MHMYNMQHSLTISAFPVLALKYSQNNWNMVRPCSEKSCNCLEESSPCPYTLSFPEHIVTKCFLCIKNSGNMLLGTLRSSVMESWADESYPLWAALLRPWETSQPEKLGSLYFFHLSLCNKYALLNMLHIHA